jgi:hypothetical protein
MDCKLKKNRNSLLCRKKGILGVVNGKIVTKKDIFVGALLLMVGIVWYYTNVMRASAGWFDNGAVIFWNTLAYITFFALFTGYAVAKLIGKR